MKITASYELLIRNTISESVVVVLDVHILHLTIEGVSAQEMSHFVEKIFYLLLKS